jgi:hypothetical protein
MIIGPIKPRIYLPYLPKNIDSKYIIRHELLHLKRKDIILKPIISFVKAVYWFNPFVHLLSKMMNEDMELCCDEDVLKLSSNSNGISYSESLLFMMKNSNNNINTNVSHFIGGRKHMMYRIENILNTKNKMQGFLWGLFIIVLTFIVTIFVGCNVVSSEDAKHNEIYKDTEVNEKEENLTTESEKISDSVLNVMKTYASEDSKSEAIEFSVNQVHFSDYTEIPEYRYFYNYINLDEDEDQEIMVYLVGLEFSGSGGSTLDIYDIVDDTLVHVSTMTLVNNPIYISETITNGWHDIILYVSGGGAEANYRLMKFDETYPTNPSVEEILPINDYKVIEVINDDITPDNGIKNQ